MKRNTSFSLLFFLSLLFLIFFTFSVDARKTNIKKKLHKDGGNRHTRGKGSHPPSPLPRYESHPTQVNTFDIMSFGAKGNGVSDDSEALVAAWECACKISGATIKVPAKFKFLIKPITLQGPCMNDLTLQIDGIVLAPSEVSSWPKSSLFQWINFKWVQNFTIKGSGTVDGQGSNWWILSELYDMQKTHSEQIPSMKPTAIRFYSSNFVKVRDIKIINSPLCHLKFDNSKGIKVDNITIISPANSPNTDGIHLQNTQDVEIQHSHIGTGDDCVSIQTGCSNIHVHHIKCGPGHGISLGGLGKDKSVACVSDIIVEDISMKNTLYGARIKTWQGGIGMVKNVSFSRIKAYDVMFPIMIDQYYCDKQICKNQTGTVVISGVKFDQISGSYSVQPVHLACSNSIPCTDVDLTDIQLRPSLKYRGLQQAMCWNSYGKSQGQLVPSSIDYCLRSGGGLIKRIARSHDSVCYKFL
ncbi:probable polygalacturonase At1g80170 [Cicer arietinum]|uniref:Probable polygalacturonase At1g80170 n=1 Tax=Cicer arietinum TaxID=3827 RepID=A0A1S2XIB4_CICAR|nr:probable polygalacturonase At1g80170 [Cicer arietinum]